MKIFNIYATPKRIFKITADTFLKLVDLFFNNNTNISLSAKIIEIKNLLMNLTTNQEVSLDESKIKYEMSASNKDFLTTFISLSSPMMEKQGELELLLKDSSSFQFSMYDNYSFETTMSINILANAILVVMKSLGEFDNLTVGELDDLILQNMDYRIIE